MESGESPEEALVRELREELLIDVTIGVELAHYEYEYASGSGVHLLFFSVTNFIGQPTNRVYKQICWTPLRDLPAIDFLEGDKVDERALKNLVRAAIDYNQTKLKKNAGARAKARTSKKT